jgi:2-dehydro-3-deoxyphosphogluconate aldolase / (4S)-4-hydroxy-2-oxoglutarate aldolase
MVICNWRRSVMRLILNKIEETGIVSIVRGIDEAKISETVKALYEGGIRILEITFDTPGASRMIEKIKQEYMGKITIGAGTVLDSDTARTAILAGADFVLSPSLK